ncbi:MAG: ATP-dependent helicase HrpB [Gammaproteobacteria bacterium]|nr:ATP-dependent helicase HrpB [Gammaproteobacteria bacterium]
MADLPVNDCLGALRAALSAHALVLLSAPPGSGKTTAVPPALLDEAWLNGRKILMLEPRRAAARAACEWMARSRGEAPGGTIGYRTRQSQAVSAHTRIEIITEGILTRRVQRDPLLEDVGLVIFDEVHERHLHTDLGLALVCDVQAALRPDLRALLMSATLDQQGLRAHFPNAPCIESEGRQHPVTVLYPERSSRAPLVDQIRAALVCVLPASTGDVLVFVPGAAEIRACQQGLADLARAAGVRLCRLHGDMNPAEQDEVLRVAADRRVIFATAIAQTSLTLPAVDAVIDSGLMRVARHDRTTGFTRLLTLPASQDVTLQRAGRAGRVRPGLCYRLWTASEQAGRPRFAPPEIETVDLGLFALDLAAWGTPTGAGLTWLTPPPEPALAAAFTLLESLGFTHADRSLTPAGRLAAQAGMAPRQAALILHDPPHPTLALVLAVLLADRDPARDLNEAGIDARLRWLSAHRDAGFRRLLDSVGRRLGVDTRWQGEGIGDADLQARILWAAYRDRLAVATGPRGVFKLVTGARVQVRADDPLAQAPALLALVVDDSAQAAFVRLAAPVSAPLLRAWADACATDTVSVTWDERAHRVTARRERRFGEIALQSVPVAVPPPAAVVPILVEAVRRSGMSALPWPDEAEALRARVHSLAHWQPGAGWPDLSSEALAATAETWLPAAFRAVADASVVDVVRGIVYGVLREDQRLRLERDAPRALALRTRRLWPIRYQPEGPAILAAPIQEFYGLSETPRIPGGVPLVLELLSPGGRPVQTTSDLPRFWQTGYPALRRQLAARYPRHAWPDDPLNPPRSRHQGA